MSTYGAARGFDESDGRDLSPAEGWTAVALFVVMLLALGIAVDSARWVGTTVAGDSRTGFLPFVLLAGGAWGFVGAKSNLPAALVHLVGAGIGAAFVIVLVAGVNSSAVELTARLQDLSASLDRFGVDLFVRQVRSPETSAFLLVTGCIAWATGAYAAFAVFRRHRPMDALVVLGLLLLANIALSFEFLFGYLVVFATAGLLLLVRANLDEQRSGWLRRRIGDAGHVSGLFMRSGLTFVAVAVIGAVLLTTVASSDPLAGMWRSHQSELASLGQQLNQWVGGLTAPARGPNNLFGTSMAIQSRWESDPAIAYLAKPSDDKPHYWRVATYDRFNGSSWDQTDRVGVRVEAGRRDPRRDAAGRHRARHARSDRRRVHRHPAERRLGALARGTGDDRRPRGERDAEWGGRSRSRALRSPTACARATAISSRRSCDGSTRTKDSTRPG